MSLSVTWYSTAFMLVSVPVRLLSRYAFIDSNEIVFALIDEARHLPLAAVSPGDDSCRSPSPWRARRRARAASDRGLLLLRGERLAGEVRGDIGEIPVGDTLEHARHLRHVAQAFAQAGTSAAPGTRCCWPAREGVPASGGALRRAVTAPQAAALAAPRAGSALDWAYAAHAARTMPEQKTARQMARIRRAAPAVTSTSCSSPCRSRPSARRRRAPIRRASA